MIDLEWVDKAEPWMLRAEKAACMKRIEDLWADPDQRLARNRYDLHDEQINMIRRIDARLESSTLVT